MQFRLRTLLIVLAVGPPMLAGAWWAWATFQGLILLALIFVLPQFLYLVPPLIDWLLGVKNRTKSPGENRSTLPDR
jgi:hypothetical protein